MIEPWSVPQFSWVLTGLGEGEAGSATGAARLESGSFVMTINTGYMPGDRIGYW